jgi:RNA polymerase-associated protein
MRRSVTTLYCADDLWSHRARIVVAEKGIPLEVVLVDPARPPEDLIDLNPYQSLPTLVDRDLVLYDSRVIMDYVDERYPHPPLMPVDPTSRAQIRLATHRVEKDWYAVADALEQESDRGRRATLRRALRDSIVQAASLFALRRFFLSDEFTLADATIAPVLWRLPQYEVELPGQAQAVLRYAGQVFARPAFATSLAAGAIGQSFA